MQKLTTLWLLLSISLTTFAQSVYTWNDHIAPIIYDNCSSCHHDGGIAYFNLMTYQDVVTWAEDVHEAMEDREMPPWPADPNYRNFVGEVILDQAEIDLVHDWMLEGMELGDPGEVPPPPVFGENGSLLDRIDYTVAIEPYTLQSNTDEYRWFVIETNFTDPVYISKLEVFPGLPSIVHHADLSYDNTGNSLANDLLDPLPGFNQGTGTPTYSFYINAWQPGGNPAIYPDDWGIRVPPGADFVIEIHYGPGGIGQVDSTKMNLQFIQDPQNTRPVEVGWLLYDTAPCLVDGPLVIPANEVVTFHQESAPLQNDISLISICPHMHQLGKSYRVWFESPTGDSVPLIDIPQWDFHWQKYYTFQQIQKIPAGSILKSEGVYDNTVNNDENPNNPPQTVTKGWTTEDEMFLCYFIYADYEAGDENIILDSTLLTSVPPLSERELNFTLFPNPAKQVLYIQADMDSKFQYRIINVFGQVLHESEMPKQDAVNIDFLPNGLYYLELYNEDISASKAFMKM